MIRAYRFTVQAMIAAAVCAGCSTTPGSPRAREEIRQELPSVAESTRHALDGRSSLGDVAISTETRTPTDSSFNASVVNRAGEINWSFAASSDPAAQRMTRLESSWVRRLDGADEQLKFGDTISSAGSWGTAVRYAGVQFGTALPQRSDVLASSSLATPGLAVLPSTLDAVLPTARRESSGLTLDGSARLVSVNSVSFVARDSLGRTQLITQPLFASTVFADPGCSSYSLGMGKVREDFALTSNAYGPWFANATVRCGLVPGLAVEGHGEYLDGQTALGVQLAKRLGLIGVASVAVASSRDELESGWLARVGLEHSNSTFDLMVRTRLQSRGYRETGSELLLDPVKQRTLTSLGFKAGDFGKVAVMYVTQTTFERTRADVLALTQSMQVGAVGRLSLTAGHSLMEDADSSVLIFYTRPLGWQRTQTSDMDITGILAPAFEQTLPQDSSGLRR